MIYFCEMLQIKPQRHSDPLTENYYFREYTPKEISQQKQKEKKRKKIFMRKLCLKTVGGTVCPLMKLSYLHEIAL